MNTLDNDNAQFVLHNLTDEEIDSSVDYLQEVNEETDGYSSEFSECGEELFASRQTSLATELIPSIRKNHKKIESLLIYIAKLEKMVSTDNAHADNTHSSSDVIFLNNYIK